MSKLQSKTNYIIVENYQDKFQVWKSTKSNNSKSMMHSYGSCALLLNELYLPMKFQVSSLITLWVMLRTKFKNEKWTKGNKSNMKFHVDALHSFKVMLQTKKGRTDRQTDKSITMCHPSGGIKTINLDVHLCKDGIIIVIYRLQFLLNCASRRLKHPTYLWFEIVYP